MYSKLVKDFMIPVADYPTVNQDATMLDAIRILRASQSRVPEGAQAFRAVLVEDNTGRIIGKVGHLSFLKALEPKYNLVFDMEKLTRANLSSNFVETMMDHFQLWDEGSLDLCLLASGVNIVDIMQPVIENVDENETLPKAIHKIIMWGSLSVLVTKGLEIVGILRLSDIYNEIEEYIINECKVK